MIESRRFPLKIVDGLRLGEAHRQALRPGEIVHDEEGRARRLPRFFYEIDTWRTAKETQLAPLFGLYEFLHTDVREAAVLRHFPRYVPCAIVLLASQLAVLRERVGTYVHIACNGGYRSPGHGLSYAASPHMWGTAVNIYRIGDDWLDDQETIQRYGEIARQALPYAWARPWGHSRGYADDHLHLDLGYVTVVPRDAASELAPEEEADHV